MLTENSSLEYGVFPDTWKLVKVIPICKSGPKYVVNSYRSITVILAFPKCYSGLLTFSFQNFLKPIRELHATKQLFGGYSPP